jgi:hypothetical protein
MIREDAQQAELLSAAFTGNWEDAPPEAVATQIMGWDALPGNSVP